MITEISYLLHDIRDWHRRGASTPKWDGSIPLERGRTTLLPPEITWALLGLIYYRARKRHASAMLRKRLPAQVAAERQCASIKIEEGICFDRRGIVPGRPEWSFILDGHISFVTNRVTGEHIHVDVFDGPDIIQSNYFGEYLAKLRRPNAVAQRLLEMFPGGRGLAAAINRLRDYGLFHIVNEYDWFTDALDFELCDALNPFGKAVTAYLKAWGSPEDRQALAAVIGDWAAIQHTIEATGDTADDELIKLVSASRQRWLAYLRYEAGGFLSEGLLHALANANAEDLPEYLLRALDDPFVAHAALNVIGDDPSFRKPVADLFRAAVKGERDLTHVKGAAAHYLARAGARVEPLLKGLLTRPVYPAVATLLALEFAPQHLLRLLRRGLRSPERDDRLTAAAILALIDTQQSRQELLAILDESSDHDATIECRAALLESPSPDAHLAVEAWEAEHPERTDVPAKSARHMYCLDGGCDQAMRERMSELADRVNALDRKQVFFARRKTRKDKQ